MKWMELESLSPPQIYPDISRYISSFFNVIISAFNPKLGIKGAPEKQKLQYAAGSQTHNISSIVY